MWLPYRKDYSADLLITTLYVQYYAKIGNAVIFIWKF